METILGGFFRQANDLSTPKFLSIQGSSFKIFYPCSASMISLSTGCVGGWSSPATPRLMEGTSGLGIRALSVNEASWVGSLMDLGALFGSIPAGYLSFRLGRRIYLLLLAWPIVIGWLLIMFNQNNVRMTRD